jgi:hypothetical protein
MFCHQYSLVLAVGHTVFAVLEQPFAEKNIFSAMAGGFSNCSPSQPPATSVRRALDPRPTQNLT